MKISLRLSALLFLVAAVSSCQKVITEPTTPVTPPVIISDSITLLSRIAFVDINNSPTDTIAFYDFTFDSLRRVQTISLSEENNGVINPGAVITYYYKANDTLAWKKTEIDTDPVYGYTFTDYYLYDSQQRLIKDSTNYQPETEVYNFTYLNTMIIMQGNYHDPAIPSNNATLKDTGFIGITGDIIKTNAIRDANSYSFSLSYDNHPNPFFPLNIRSTYNPIPGYNFFLEDLNLQRNNLISNSEKYHSSLETYTYTYSALGYPATIDIYYQDAPQDNYRMVFFYNKL